MTYRQMATTNVEFIPERLRHAVETSSLESNGKHRRLIVPGFTSPLMGDFVEANGCQVEAGPICVVELPLFPENRWISSTSPEVRG